MKDNIEENIVTVDFKPTNTEVITHKKTDKKYTTKDISNFIDESETIIIGWRDKLCDELQLKESQQYFNDNEVDRFKLVKKMKRTDNMTLLDIKRTLAELSDIDSFTNERIMQSEDTRLLVQKIVSTAVSIELGNIIGDLKKSVISELSEKIDKSNKNNMYLLSELNKGFDSKIKQLERTISSGNDYTKKRLNSVNEIDNKLSCMKEMMEERKRELNSKKSLWSRIFNK